MPPVNAHPPLPVIGADGCPLGPTHDAWVGFIITHANQPPRVFHARTTRDLWSFAQSHNVQRIDLDVPIGLPTVGPREADTLARKLLGPRRASVFPAPQRWLLNFTDIHRADAYKRRVLKQTTKVQRQMFNILPRIRAVDDLLRTEPTARAIISEVHPELCFWSLNARTPLDHPKRTDEGFAERLSILARFIDNPLPLITAAHATTKPLGVNRDDLIDALVCLVTAMAPPSHRQTIPPTPPLDEHQLPMQMVFRTLEPQTAPPVA
ncbi:MAG: DUF429 domain-containing protein [Phycisphaerales bacterium]|nr:DUF429 domain-containing protein [Phycisphaerales bacterium]